MPSLGDILLVPVILIHYPVAVAIEKCEWLARRIARTIIKVKKLEKKMETLTTWYENLCSVEGNIRSHLRRFEAHRVKVHDMYFSVSLWLDRVEGVKNRVNALRRSIEEHPRCFFDSCSRLKLAADVAKLMDEVEFLQDKGTSLLHTNLNIAPVNAALFSSRIVGNATHKVLGEIWECLLNPDIGTVGIYGLGGVGKSTAMRNIADQLGKTDVFDKIIWVTVSKNLDPVRILADVFLQLGLADAGLLFDKNKKLLSDRMKNLKKHLFVFDDMWTDFFHVVQIPPPTKENGCKVVVISRFQDICVKMKADKLITLAPLSQEEAWDLFVNKASHHVLDPDIEGIARKVVNECGGLPITITSVGHAMRDAQTVDEWSIALADILPLYENFRNEVDKGDISYLLRFAYSRLKNYVVRKCFLYCALFPVGYRFGSKQLICYWMAEHFIYTNEGLLTAINEGLDILRELQDANMLELLTERGNEWLTMPDLFRDLAVSIMTSEEPGLIVRAGLGLSECPHHSEWVGARQISLIRNQIEILYADDPVCPHLTTLLLQDNPIPHISPSFFDHMPLLAILDLSYTGIIELPPSLSELSKLRVLFLQYCTSLRSVPSLEKLKELWVLNLSGTFIKELPQGIKGLLSLRSLDLSETIRLQKMEAGTISSLSNLLELCMQGSRLCELGSGQEPTHLKELRCLKKLEILTVSSVGYGDHLDTILHLQGQALKSFRINVYGSTGDCIEDVEEL